MSQNDEKLEFDISSGADYLGPHFSERQLRRAVQGDRVRHTRLGLKVLFSRQMLDEFVAANTFGGAA